MQYKNYDFPIFEEQVIRVITDTDAKNEADDQYAIAHTLLTQRFDNLGVIGAHFGDQRSKTSMQDSYDEVCRLLDYLKMPKSLAYKGAAHALPDEATPVDSPGARLIIEAAMADDKRPLFVTFLGPLTDLASAYLLEPAIAGRLTAIWIGGGPYPGGGDEYNLSNDINAANVVMKSAIPLWQVPRPTYMQMRVSLAELQTRVRPQGALGKYLFDQLVENASLPETYTNEVRTGEVWFLGDSPVVGLMMWDHPYDYEWMQTPEITREMHYVHNKRHRPIRVYNRIDSRFILEDMYAKLALFAEKE